MYKPSRQENYIRDYLEKSNIKFITEYRIDGLSGDHKSYRVVDFYLPRLDIYLEYFGLYNSTKERRKEYDLKAKTYIENSLPSIFILPEELGYLDYAVHTHIVKLLSRGKFKSRFKFWRYCMNRYFMKGKPFYVLIAFYLYMFGLILIELDIGLNFFVAKILGWTCFITALYVMYGFIMDIIRQRESNRIK